MAVDLGESLRQTGSGLGGEVKDTLAVDLGEKSKTLAVDLGEKSKTGRPNIKWQWTWGRSQRQVYQRQTGSGLGGEVKDRWSKDTMAVDLGKSQRQVDQRQTGSGLLGEVKNKLAMDLMEKSKIGRSKTNRQWTWGRSQT
jgi:hypothetical protein